jgi:hypothetical protein
MIPFIHSLRLVMNLATTLGSGLGKHFLFLAHLGSEFANHDFDITAIAAGQASGPGTIQFRV